MYPIIQDHPLFGKGAQRVGHQGIGWPHRCWFGRHLQVAKRPREYPRIDTKAVASPL